MKKSRKTVLSILDSLLQERIAAENNELPLCAWCKEEILNDDLAPTHPAKYHRNCLIRVVVGSVGHQTERCPCFGGNEEDPPGLTARQAATAAATAFRKHLQGLNTRSK